MVSGRISGASGRSAAVSLLASVGVAVCVASTAAATDDAASRGIERYVQQKGDEKGFTVNPGIQLAKSVVAWVHSFDDNYDGEVDGRRWKAEGFLAGAFADTISTNGNDQGVSWAEEYGSSAGARAEQVYVATKQLKSTAEIHFKVSKVPGADGIGYLESAKSKVIQDTDIVWTEGRCTLLLGNGTSTGSVSVPALTAAAQKLYARTHGRCPS